MSSGLLVPGLLWACMSSAQVEIPALRARVSDLTATLQPAQVQALESKLAAFEREHGSQVAVLLVPTTQPETIEQYAIRVVEHWQLGRAQQDDGVLLLIAKSDRTLRIEVGQGLEGAIPDAVAKRIIEEQMLPRLRAGDFAGGIEAGVDTILGLIRGEGLPAPARAAPGGSAFEKALPMLFVLIFAGQFLRRLLGRLPGAGLVGGFAFLLGWLLTGALLIALLFALAAFVLTLTGLSSGGGWHSRGGGGGFGGGGFRGGGGGFSGGGASGRW